MRILMILPAALILVGCQTTEQRLSADEATCKSYGVAPGTPAYVQCRMQLDTNRANVNASERFGQGEGLISRIGRAAGQ